MAADIAGENLYCLQSLHSDRVVRSSLPDIALHNELSHNKNKLARKYGLSSHSRSHLRGCALALARCVNVKWHLRASLFERIDRT